MVSVKTSNYLSTLDSKIVADLCEGKFFVDVSNNTYLAPNGMLGGAIKIENPYGVVIKDYPTPPLYDIDASDMGQVKDFPIPTEADTFVYGSYAITVKVTDIDDKSFEITKTIVICEPDAAHPSNNFGLVNTALTGDCKNGKLSVSIAPPPAYRSKLAESIKVDGSLEFPTSSGVLDKAFTVSNFSVALFEGVYKSSADICATYNFSDRVYVSVPYKAKTRKEIFCSIDFCCVYEKIEVLNARINSDCSDEDKYNTANTILEVLLCLRTSELAALCGKDPSEYIERLQDLLGCTCGGCDCDDATPIINNDPCQDFNIIGCNTSKNVVGLTTTYTINNYSYEVAVAPNGGILVASAPVQDGCKKIQTLTFDITKLPQSGGSCDYYLDPATDEAWATPAAADDSANGGIPLTCKSHGYRFLSYNAIGNEQIYWYVDNGSGSLIIDEHRDYQSDGENASRMGSLTNHAMYKNSIVLGHGCFVGNLRTVTAWNAGTGELTVTAGGGSFAASPYIGIFRYGFPNELYLAEISGSVGNVVTLSVDPFIVDPTGNESEYRVVILNLDNTKYGSFAAGVYSVAEGVGAIALAGGWAVNDGSVAILGGITKQDGSFAVMGKVDGGAFGGVAIGNATLVSSTGGIAIGYGAKVTGNQSVSIGFFCEAAASDGAFAGGYYTYAGGKYSFVVGRQTRTDNAAEFAFGGDKFPEFNSGKGKHQGAFTFVDGETTTLGGEMYLSDPNSVEKLLRGGLVHFDITILAQTRANNSNYTAGFSKAWRYSGTWAKKTGVDANVVDELPITIIRQNAPDTDTWDVTPEIDVSLSGLVRIKVVGNGNIRWGAMFRLHELSAAFNTP